MKPHTIYDVLLILIICITAIWGTYNVKHAEAWVCYYSVWPRSNLNMNYTFYYEPECTKQNLTSPFISGNVSQCVFKEAAYIYDK